jgi:hypothetical protein
LVHFSEGSCIFAWWVLDCHPPTSTSLVAGIIGMYHHAWQECIFSILEKKQSKKKKKKRKSPKVE